MDDFDFFDEVYVDKSIIPSDTELLGTILGKSETDSGKAFYAVLIESLGESYMCPPEALRKTGRKRDPKDVYPGDRIRVIVDPETGEGKIIPND